MNFLANSILFGSIVLLAGCSMPSADDYQHASVTPHLVAPKGVELSDQQDYYPVPGASGVAQSAKQPSLLPPNAHLDRYQQSADSARSKKISAIRWSKKDNNPVLLLSQSAKKTYAKVGSALQHTDLQVLDKDVAMTSYFILDTAQTGKQVTEKTPIYRIAVEKVSANSARVVLTGENDESVAEITQKNILGAIEKYMA